MATSTKTVNISLHCVFGYSHRQDGGAIEEWHSSIWTGKCTTRSKGRDHQLTAYLRDADLSLLTMLAQQEKARAAQINGIHCRSIKASYP